MKRTIRIISILVLLLTGVLALASLRTTAFQAQVRAQPATRSLRVAPGSLPRKLALAWRYKTDKSVSSSALVDGSRLFIGSDDGNIYALRRSDGDKIWAYKTKGAVEAKPLLVNDLLVCGSADGNLYALDANSGTLRWKYPTDDKILGGANAAPSPDGKTTWIVVGSYDNYVHCVNAATGKRVWAYETENYVNGSPVLSDGRVIFGGCDGSLYVINFATGKKLRSIPLKSYIAGSAAVDGRLAYLGHYGNEVVCVDVGANKINWTFRDRAFPYFSSPAVTADRVVIGGRDKRLHCLNRQTGKPVWEFRTRGNVDSSPMICDGKVVVGSEDGRLYMVGMTDGKEIWSYQIGSPVISSPTIADGTVYVGADDGYVYAFH